jgi:hypothetical protein
VVDKLADCGKKGPTPLKSVNYDLAFIVHVTEDDEEARVDEVMLMDSTLHLHEVEVCMTNALYGMRTPLEALALRRRKLAPDPTVAPEARAMFGQAEAVPLLELAALIVVGYATYTVVVHLIEDKHRTKPWSHPAKPETAEPPAPALSAATAEPTATAAPTATTVPITTAVPKARRNPNQTCDDEELDRLEEEKNKLCQGKYAADCSPDQRPKVLARIPCSAIMRSLEKRLICLSKRKLIQDKCFGGVPDAGHKMQMGQVQNGINNCEALKLVNCAKGHPMAGL